jgi:hypothetical protein
MKSPYPKAVSLKRVLPELLDAPADQSPWYPPLIEEHKVLYTGKISRLVVN